jgi:hypothetical protein
MRHIKIAVCLVAANMLFGQVDENEPCTFQDLQACSNISLGEFETAFSSLKSTNKAEMLSYDCRLDSSMNNLVTYLYVKGKSSDVIVTDLIEATDHKRTGFLFYGAMVAPARVLFDMAKWRNPRFEWTTAGSEFAISYVDINSSKQIALAGHTNSNNWITLYTPNGKCIVAFKLGATLSPQDMVFDFIPAKNYSGSDRVLVNAVNRILWVYGCPDEYNIMRNSYYIFTYHKSL